MHGRRDRVTYDYITFVKEDPESTAQCMDLAAQFFDLYENMSTEVESLLSVYTDPESVVTRREMLESEAQKTRYGFSTNVVRNPNLVEPKVESLETPIYSPMSPNTIDIPCIGYHFNAYGWEIPNSFEPIEPTGWGTDEEEDEMESDCYFISREEYEAGRVKEEEGQLSQG